MLENRQKVFFKNSVFISTSIFEWRIILLFLLIISFACNSKKAPPSQPETEVVTDSQVVTSPKPSPTIAKAIDYDTSLWKELGPQNDIYLDLRYATTNNFVEEQLYDCSRCFLRPKVAKALLKAQASLKEKGLRFKLFDCFRPRQIQERLWAKVPNATYVTPPTKGSMHNRGTAVDLTLVNEQGKELDMGTEFDYFGPAAHHTYKDLPEEVLNNRSLLKSTMEQNGFRAIRTEWWHYSYRGMSFPLDTMLWQCE